MGLPSLGFYVGPWLNSPIWPKNLFPPWGGGFFAGPREVLGPSFLPPGNCPGYFGAFPQKGLMKPGKPSRREEARGFKSLEVFPFLILGIGIFFPLFFNPYKNL